MVKNPLANAGDIRDTGLIPGLGRSPGGGHATQSGILVWRIPWTEESVLYSLRAVVPEVAKSWTRLKLLEAGAVSAIEQSGPALCSVCVCV